jgi:hypothetical protein
VCLHSRAGYIIPAADIDVFASNGSHIGNAVTSEGGDAIFGLDFIGADNITFSAAKGGFHGTDKVVSVSGSHDQTTIRILLRLYLQEIVCTMRVVVVNTSSGAPVSHWRMEVLRTQRGAGADGGGSGGAAAGNSGGGGGGGGGGGSVQLLGRAPSHTQLQLQQVPPPPALSLTALQRLFNGSLTALFRQVALCSQLTAGSEGEAVLSLERAEQLLLRVSKPGFETILQVRLEEQEQS